MKIKLLKLLLSDQGNLRKFSISMCVCVCGAAAAGGGGGGF